jgi:hypothetical protein
MEHSCVDATVDGRYLQGESTDIAHGHIDMAFGLLSDGRLHDGNDRDGKWNHNSADCVGHVTLFYSFTLLTICRHFLWSGRCHSGFFEIMHNKHDQMQVPRREICH